MRYPHEAEWEWGWKTPLLLRFGAQTPGAIHEFLDTPLERLDLKRAEDELEKSLAALRTYRLGVRFERIQSALLAAHPDTADLRSGLVVPGKTEIDFLHRLHSLPGTLVHWELAVKFYLGLDDNGSSDPDRFVGPSLKDTLGKKLRTVFNRQLSILEDPLVRSQYASAFGIREDDHILPLPKIHGVLFDPYTRSTPTLRPDLISEKGLRGIWAEFPDFVDLLEREKPTGFQILFDRQDWIRKTERTNFKHYLNSPLETRLQSHFSEIGTPIQGALYSENSEEETRFFLVPKGWRDAANRM